MGCVPLFGLLAREEHAASLDVNVPPRDMSTTVFGTCVSLLPLVLVAPNITRCFLSFSLGYSPKFVWQTTKDMLCLCAGAGPMLTSCGHLGGASGDT